MVHDAVDDRGGGRGAAVRMAFGPDTEDGLIPAGRVFAYYGIFFAFGVFFRQRDIAVRRW